MLCNEERGQALLAVIVVLTVIMLLGASTLSLTAMGKRSVSMQQQRAQAYYVAEAGVEKALTLLARDQAWEDPEGWQLAGKWPEGMEVGEIDRVRVRKTQLQPKNARRVEIIATGSYEESVRTLRVVVDLSPGVPQETVTAFGPATIAANTLIHGVWFSNDTIRVRSNLTMKPNINGHRALYCSHPGPQAMQIDNSADLAFPKDAFISEVRTRGDILGQHQIKGQAEVFPYDLTAKTQPLPIQDLFNLEKLLDRIDYVNHTFGGKATVDPENGRAIFNGEHRSIDLNGKTYLYTKGVEFKDITIYGEGTILVTPDSFSEAFRHDYALLLENVSGPTDNDGLARLNLIVLSGNWGEQDIYISSNVDLQGLVYAEGDISLGSNVRLHGLVIGRGLNLGEDIVIVYDPLIPWVPTKQGVHISILHWQEV